MPVCGTLDTPDRTPPPFFRQGPSALSKLAVCSALALFLMVADSRFKVMQPLRVALATVIVPRIQWLAMRPVHAGLRTPGSISRPCAGVTGLCRKRPIASTTCSRSAPTRSNS
jgi:hypothetical protein